MRLIYHFNQGFIGDLVEGTTLRAFLSDRLWCNPMRITKKLHGSRGMGKRTYHRATDPSAPRSMNAARFELELLEARMNAKLAEDLSANNRGALYGTRAGWERDQGLPAANHPPPDWVGTSVVIGGGDGGVVCVGDRSRYVVGRQQLEETDTLSLQQNLDAVAPTTPFSVVATKGLSASPAPLCSFLPPKEPATAEMARGRGGCHGGGLYHRRQQHPATTLQVMQTQDATAGAVEGSRWSAATGIAGNGRRAAFTNGAAVTSPTTTARGSGGSWEGLRVSPTTTGAIVAATGLYQQQSLCSGSGVETGAGAGSFGGCGETNGMPLPTQRQEQQCRLFPSFNQQQLLVETETGAQLNSYEQLDVNSNSIDLAAGVAGFAANNGHFEAASYSSSEEFIGSERLQPPIGAEQAPTGTIGDAPPPLWKQQQQQQQYQQQQQLFYADDGALNTAVLPDRVFEPGGGGVAGVGASRDLSEMMPRTALGGPSDGFGRGGGGSGGNLGYLLPSRPSRAECTFGRPIPFSFTSSDNGNVTNPVGGLIDGQYHRGEDSDNLFRHRRQQQGEAGYARQRASGSPSCVTADAAASIYAPLGACLSMLPSLPPQPLPAGRLSPATTDTTERHSHVDQYYHRPIPLHAALGYSTALMPPSQQAQQEPQQKQDGVSNADNESSRFPPLSRMAVFPTAEGLCSVGVEKSEASTTWELGTRRAGRAAGTACWGAGTPLPMAVNGVLQTTEAAAPAEEEEEVGSVV